MYVQDYRAVSASPPIQSGGAARIARLAPFFLLGPISGPLLAGVVFNFRGGRPVLGSLYALALALFLALLPLIAAKIVIPTFA
jgi:hypothetical protein